MVPEDKERMPRARGSQTLARACIAATVVSCQAIYSYSYSARCIETLCNRVAEIDSTSFLYYHLPYIVQPSLTLSSPPFSAQIVKAAILDTRSNGKQRPVARPRLGLSHFGHTRPLSASALVRYTRQVLLCIAFALTHSRRCTVVCARTYECTTIHYRNINIDNKERRLGSA